MVRWAGTNTGCPNHINYPINLEPATVSKTHAWCVSAERSERGEGE